MGDAPPRRSARAGAGRRHGQARRPGARLRIRPRPGRPLRRAERRPAAEAPRLLRPRGRSPLHDAHRDHAHRAGLPRRSPSPAGRQGDGPRARAGDPRSVPRRRGRPLGAPGARARPARSSETLRSRGGSWRSGGPASSGPGSRRPSGAEIHHVRTRMELELGREGPGRIHLKFGAGGLVDIEFLVQVLQLTPRRAARRAPDAVDAPRARAPRRARAPAGGDRPSAARGATRSCGGFSGPCGSPRRGRPTACPTTGHVLARLAREAGLDGGRALHARHREVAEFVRAEYFRIVGATGPAGGTA